MRPIRQLRTPYMVVDSIELGIISGLLRFKVVSASWTGTRRPVQEQVAGIATWSGPSQGERYLKTTLLGGIDVKVIWSQVVRSFLPPEQGRNCGGGERWVRAPPRPFHTLAKDKFCTWAKAMYYLILTFTNIPSPLLLLLTVLTCVRMAEARVDEAGMLRQGISSRTTLKPCMG